MYYDLLRSNEVKCWSKPSNQGQIGQISRNIPNIHMFRLRILSRIQIQNSLRSNQVIKRSNLGQTWVRAVKLGSNRVDKSKFTQYTYSSTPNFVQNTNSEFFEVKSGHQEVKLGSKPSNQGQIGQISRNISNIHMFRLGILSRIQIQDSLRSN